MKSVYLGVFCLLDFPAILGIEMNELGHVIVVCPTNCNWFHWVSINVFPSPPPFPSIFKRSRAAARIEIRVLDQIRTIQEDGQE